MRNHTRFGVSLGGSADVTARYLKIHHNTDPSDTTNSAAGRDAWASSRSTTPSRRSEIFRNGQDAIARRATTSRVAENYLHDHYCNHPDGIQAFVPTSNATCPTTRARSPA